MFANCHKSDTTEDLRVGIPTTAFAVAGAVVGIVGLVVAAAWDLAIAVAWYEPGSPWARFAARWGEVPGYVLWALGLVVLIRTTPRPATAADRLAMVGGSVLLLVVTGAAVDAVIGPIGPIGTAANGRPSIPLIVRAVQAALVCVVLAGASGLVVRSQLRSFRPAARFSVWLCIVVPGVLVQGGKLLWGRVRFRDLPDVSAFTPFWLPQGLTGQSAMPSGHAAMAWVVLPMLLSLPGLRRSPALTIGAAVVGVLWGILVSASRIRIGAHYLSDVVVSAGAALIAASVIAAILERSRAER